MSQTAGSVVQRDSKPELIAYRGGPRYDMWLERNHEKVAEDMEHHPEYWVLFAEEMRTSDDIMLMAGSYFYTAPVSLEPDDIKVIRAILLENEDTYKPHVPKFCGGFHPDWLITIDQGQKEVCSYLICFTCHEVIILCEGKAEHWDLSDDAYAKLGDTLPEGNGA